MAPSCQLLGFHMSMREWWVKHLNRPVHSTVVYVLYLRSYTTLPFGGRSWITLVFWTICHSQTDVCLSQEHRAMWLKKCVEQQRRKYCDLAKLKCGLQYLYISTWWHHWASCIASCFTPQLFTFSISTLWACKTKKKKHSIILFGYQWIQFPDRTVGLCGYYILMIFFFFFKFGFLNTTTTHPKQKT